jgi:hypothetical protein
MLSDFSYASNCQSHILDRTTWLSRITWLEKTICFIYGVRITSDYESSLVTGPKLVCLQCHVSDHSWSCFLPFGHHWFHSKSLLWLPVLEPSHPGPATFRPCWTHSLVLIWLPLNCCINVAWIQRPCRLQHCERCTLCTMIKSVK